MPCSAAHSRSRVIAKQCQLLSEELQPDMTFTGHTAHVLLGRKISAKQKHFCQGHWVYKPWHEEFLIRACTAAHGKWTKCHTGTKSRLWEYLSIFCALFAVLVKNQWNKVSCVTHLLQQKSLLVPFCQLIGGEGSLDAGPDHYAVILPCSRHLGYV